jgi:hypothetical protein
MLTTIALDIDRTLVCSVRTYYVKKEWLTMFDSFIFDNYTVFIRPHIKSFLNYLFDPENKFKVGIYTAADEEYAKVVIDKLFTPDRYEPEFVFSSTDSYQNKKFDGKDKSVEYLSYKLNIPINNILLIDDSSAIKKVNLEGCYLIPKFFICFDNNVNVFNTKAQTDEELLECKKWLIENIEK